MEDRKGNRTEKTGIWRVMGRYIYRRTRMKAVQWWRRNEGRKSITDKNGVIAFYCIQSKPKERRKKRKRN